MISLIDVLLLAPPYILASPPPSQLIPSIIDTMVFQDVFIDQLFIEPTTIDEVELP